MSLLIATTILRMVSALAASPYLTLSSLVSPFHEQRDLLAEVGGQLRQRVRRVLDGVVKEGGAQGRRGHTQLGQDVGDGQRMGDVGVAAVSGLTAMGGAPP